MRALKRTPAKYWGAQGGEAAHWQKGFFDHIMRSKKSCRQKWLYVQQNPVRDGGRSLTVAARGIPSA